MTKNLCEKSVPEEKVVPAREADSEHHLRNAEDDRDLHLEAVQHRYPGANVMILKNSFAEK
jgi:hypothetical protein